ncbi:907_t:CDS:2 [Funneliformis geosporum]|uniref:907_t:CDS:1 n=1 Tax=Funneliformis geosporum TaxID=1117311 RepID=A0A9W4SUD2_9GLOM|nr:907_t:CDS:2 [Funneliformis geosporum]
MVEYYNDNAWKAINEVLQGLQVIWLIGLGLGEGETLEEIQSIFQFVLEDGCTFRTWMKYTDIIKACKELFEDMIDWQFQEGIINEKRKQKSLESLKIVELAEQVFGANHVRGKLANEINDWHPTPASIHEKIKQSYIEHRNVIWQVCVVKESVHHSLSGFAQWRRMWEDKRMNTYCTSTISSRSRYPRKYNYRRSYYFSYQVNEDEGELDFLIQDCIKEGTYAGSDKYPLRHILTYYKDHQPQYTHLQASMLAYAYINLLKML